MMKRSYEAEHPHNFSKTSGLKKYHDVK